MRSLGFGPRSWSCGNDDPSAGCLNEMGTGGLLSLGGGITSVSSDCLRFAVSGIRPFAHGLLFMGNDTTSIPFGNGKLCVTDTVMGPYRYPIQQASALGGVGQANIVSYSHNNFGISGAILPGQTWSFQFWYRDTQGPCGFPFTWNTTNALAASFHP